MADYDSDSSGAGDIETNVLLGYASRDPTSDDFSQLGGHPTWLDDKTAPSGALAKCKVCNGYMNLLLQLNGDLPDRFPGHERRLYLWACRKKTCRRKEGSIRGFRATRQSKVEEERVKPVTAKVESQNTPTQPATNLGESLFGVKSPSNGPINPFAASPDSGVASNPFSSAGATANPFASASSLAAIPPQKPADVDTLPQTFADKARISTPQVPEASAPPVREPWPEQAAFPEQFPSYHLDADKEYIDPESTQPPAGVRLDRVAMETDEGSSSSAAEDKAAFESSMDKTFQRFADRLAQNPEQVLRYEYGAQPLLYSKTDAVGKLFAPAQENAHAKVKTQGHPSAAKMPCCTNCGAGRVFELQLTPHAITELEAEDMSVDGMDWGTVILGVCNRDCQEKGKNTGEVGYVEEWTGVQWEELASNKRPS